MVFQCTELSQLCARQSRRAYLEFLDADSLARRLVGNEVMEEEYFCNYEFNPEFHALLDNASLRISGRDARNVARLMELPDHSFYLCTQFLPQSNSTADRPHPGIIAFVRAAARRLTAP